MMKPLKKGKREAEDDLETIANLKKQKKKYENKETMEGFIHFHQLMEAKMDSLTTKVDLLTSKLDLLATNLTSLKEFVKTKNPDASAKNSSLTAKAESSASKDESSSDEEPTKDSSSSGHESEDESKDGKKVALPTKAASSMDSAVKDSNEVAAERVNIAASTPPQSSVQTIYVEGFGTSLPEDDIKTALSRHFSACGEITRVSVPTSLETGAVKGFAYIDLKEDATKALELNGSHMILKQKKLVVKTALLMRDSYPGHCGSNIGSGEPFGSVGGRFGGRFSNVDGEFDGGRFDNVGGQFDGGRFGNVGGGRFGNVGGRIGGGHFGNVGGRFGGRFGNVGGRFGGGRCGGYGRCGRC